MLHKLSLSHLLVNMIISRRTQRMIGHVVFHTGTPTRVRVLHVRRGKFVGTTSFFGRASTRHRHHATNPYHFTHGQVMRLKVLVQRLTHFPHTRTYVTNDSYIRRTLRHVKVRHHVSVRTGRSFTLSRLHHRVVTTPGTRVFHKLVRPSLHGHLSVYFFGHVRFNRHTIHKNIVSRVRQRLFRVHHQLTRTLSTSVGPLFQVRYRGWGVRRQGGPPMSVYVPATPRRTTIHLSGQIFFLRHANVGAIRFPSCTSRAIFMSPIVFA